MKKFLFACALAAISLTTSAFADCCYSDACEQSCCGSDFSGFYVGGDVGVFTNTSHRNDIDGFFPIGGTRSTTGTNVTAGVLLGYDWMCSNKLFGVVADWNWVNTDHDLDATFSGERHHESFDWFTTIRGRAGVTVCDALVYATLGAAVFRHEFRGEGVGTFRHNLTRWGWAGGVGTEFMLGCNWSLGAEILILNFSNRNHRIGAAGTTFRIGHSDTAYVGRVILNYRFGDLFGF